MKARVKEMLKAKNLPNFGPNRRQGNRTANLCTCTDTKKNHFNNALGHSFKAGDQKNVVPQTKVK